MDETTTPIDLNDPPSDPFALFEAWYAEAEHCDAIKYAHAMCLATVGSGGLPDARTVLLKHRDDDGFYFFTDTRSPKARDLEGRPEAALVFYWGPLDRQVRVRGSVEPASDEISDACFDKRPRGSKIAAWASLQSRTMECHEDLRQRVEQTTRQSEGEETVPRPPFWQAYKLTPRSVEFWQAKAHRLHERLLYTRTNATWQTNWLYP